MATYITKLAEEKGLKKVDARSDLVIELTQTDIKRALVKNSKCCAFARAAKRQYECRAAYFFRSTAWLEYDDKIVRYLLPTSMQKEIVSFDRSKMMEPGTYELQRPCKSQRMTAITKRSHARKGRHQPGDGKIQRGVRHRTTNVRTLYEPVTA